MLSNWYDLYTNNDGNLAYLNTDIDTDQMEGIQAEFEKTHKNELEKCDGEAEKINLFIQHLREKEIEHHVILRPVFSIHFE